MDIYPPLRALLFKLDPELAHALSLNAIGLSGRIAPLRGLLAAWFKSPPKPVEAFRLTFRNPIGLAAGYDKDATGWRGLTALGFGHIEVGTITLRPQPGNPKPRLFRLIPEQAVINRMGFPGQGAEFALRHLPALPQGGRKSGCVIGINLGKNKDTPLEEAANDYTSLVRSFAGRGDYLAINISSPNTVGLRRLQGREFLENLLTEIDRERQVQAARLGGRLPILVKLAPDLDDDELDDALAAIERTRMDGIIATNTTIGRDGIQSPLATETGGLSGLPLREKSTAMIAKISTRTQGRLPVIGVGGIASADDVQRKLDAGAALVQIYTGLIYHGPALIQKIMREL